MEKTSLLLAGLRLFLFMLLSACCFNLLQLSIISQILISSCVIISDIIDGKISRKINNDENKIRFRKIDTFVDKVGLLSCTIGLFVTQKLPIHLVASIFSYNAIIVVGGIIKTKNIKNLKENKISGNVFSRTSNLLTAVTFLLANNNLLIAPLIKSLVSLILISSFGISLGNHYKLMKEDNENITNIENKKTNSDEISNNDKIFESKTIIKNNDLDKNKSIQTLITDLKLYRDKIAVEHSNNISNCKYLNKDDNNPVYRKQLKRNNINKK